MVDVTVIIPTFNRLWALPDAIDSCRAQNDRDTHQVEIIVVDDGSTDGTWEWLQSQSDVVAIRQTNWGKDNAVNNGFGHARGEYVRFLDSDDMLAPGANQVQLAAARSANADVVAGGYIARLERDGTDKVHKWQHCSDFIAQQLGECDSSHYSAYLFRRSFITDIRHRQEFAFRDDRLFIIEVALKEPRVTTVDIPCLVHRHHRNERIQFRHGLVSVVTFWQELEMLRKVALWLESSNRLDCRRRRALARSLWPLAHRIAATHMQEALAVLKWIKELDSGFSIPSDTVLGKFYRIVGFRAAAYTIRAARRARDIIFRQRASVFALRR